MGTSWCSRWTPTSPTVRMICPLMAALRAGADVAIGSRYVAGGASPGLSWRRHLLSWMGSRYAAVVLGLPLRDVTGGFKGFSRRALAAIQPRTLSAAGFAVQIETTYRARLAAQAIREVPIAFMTGARAAPK